MRVIVFAIITLFASSARADSIPMWNLAGSIIVTGATSQQTVNFSADFTYQPWAIIPSHHQAVISNVVASGVGDLGDMLFSTSHFDPLSRSWIAFTNSLGNEIDLYFLPNWGQPSTPVINFAELRHMSCHTGPCSSFFSAGIPTTTWDVSVTPIQTPEPGTWAMMLLGLVLLYILYCYNQKVGNVVQLVRGKWF